MDSQLSHKDRSPDVPQAPLITLYADAIERLKSLQADPEFTEEVDYFDLQEQYPDLFL